MRPRLILLIVLLLFSLVALAQQQPPPQPAPEISITANGGLSVELYQGWPLIVTITLMNAGGSGAPLVIAPQGTSWTAAIHFTVTSSSGATVQWPLNLAGTPADPTLTLDASSSVRPPWQMSSTDTASLPPDTYQLIAVLQVANSSGWNGIAQSLPVTIQLTTEPSLTPDQQLQKTLLITQFETNAQDLDGALTTVQQYLKSKPNDPVALEAGANLLELMGYPVLAFAQANAAVNAYYQADPTPIEAPWNLLSMHQRLLTSISTSSGSLASATTTFATSESIAYSSANQSLKLTAMVSTPSGSVNQGTVLFSVSGVGKPVSATVLQGAATATFTVPGSTPVGTYPLQATYNGTSGFMGSSDSTKLMITPVPLNITANNAARKYGQLNPTFTASFTGFVNGDTASVLSGKLVCTSIASATSPASTYPINCSGLTSTNYTITYAPGSLTVATTPLTVTANSAVRQYGQPNPVFNATYAGFVNGETSSVLSGDLLCSTAANAKSPAGNYPINCSGLHSTNYAIIYVAGQLTIALACAADVSTSISITRSGFSYSIVSKRYAQTLTLTNAIGSTITGPFYVVLDNLSSDASLYNSAGSTSCAVPLGSPYVPFAGTLNAHASTTVVLQFTDPTNNSITYTTRVLAGVGQP